VTANLNSGVTRVVVVDYRKEPAVLISERDVPVVGISFQDGGRTLKIFMSDKPMGEDS
jgi:hypothetical protein